MTDDERAKALAEQSEKRQTLADSEDYGLSVMCDDMRRVADRVKELREESEDRFTQIERLEAENAALREIAQAVAARNPATTEPDYGLHTTCYYCGGDGEWDENDTGITLAHERDCVWVKARALLEPHLRLANGSTLAVENAALRETLAGVYGLHGAIEQKRILYGDALRIIAEDYRKATHTSTE